MRRLVLVWRSYAARAGAGKVHSPPGVVRRSCLSAMRVPEEYRCCVCLTASKEILAVQCPHRLCLPCSKTMGRDSCPVCGQAVPADTPLDETWPRQAATIRLQCECGAEVPLLEADDHTCDHTRKRLRPGDWLSAGPAAQRARPPPTPNRSTFTCPVCGEQNFTREGLVEHAHRCHNTGDRVSAVCPICAAMPWGDPSYVSRDFLSHLRLRHRCDYEVLADFDVDEEAMVRRALEASAREAMLAEEAAELALERALRESAMEAGVPYEPPEGNVTSSGESSNDQSRSRSARRAFGSSGSATSSGSDDADDTPSEEVDRVPFGSSRSTALPSAAFPMVDTPGDGSSYTIAMAGGHGGEGMPCFLQRAAEDSFHEGVVTAASPQVGEI